MNESSVLGQMIARVGDETGYRRWSAQVDRAGYCVRPVRLTGSAVAVDTATGEVTATYASRDEPGGVLLVACKDRREAVCPPCAARYRADAWHVVVAGLTGRCAPDDTGPQPNDGDGQEHELDDRAAPGEVPATVADHPLVLATFTAPSFGRVHAHRDGAACRTAPRGRRAKARANERCEHGKPLRCGARHGPHDPLLGAPLCDQCADLTGLVLWNAHVGELWRRTVIYVYRALAALAPALGGQALTVRGVREVLRVSYVKVAEFQRRGVVHLHVLARLDGVNPDAPEQIVAPPAWAGAELLTAALRQAAQRVSVPLPVVDEHTAAMARWGAQLDVRTVDTTGEQGARVAGYLAKYTTKTLSDSMSGLPASRMRSDELGLDQGRAVPGHVAALARKVRDLARLATCRGLRLARHVHTLGFRGHVTSKSRRYSVTFSSLRAARRAWRMARRVAGRGDPWATQDGADGQHADGSGTVLVGDWRVAGLGYRTFGDRVLAEVLGREHRQAREAVRLGLVE